MNRRSFLKTTGLFGIATATSLIAKPLKAFSETCDKIKPAPAMVTMLAYIPVSKTKGQNCANCIQYQADNKNTVGLCPIFQGCEVSAKGWCKSWSKKS
jgi:hypothetical protein